MPDTANLKLPLIAPAQAQKHVTHNEALLAIDRLVQLTVLDRDLAVPPGAPAEGARYIVATAPTGAWAGKAGQIAVWADALWGFHVPNEGWLAWVADEDVILAWNGTQWVSPPAGQTTSLFGINTSADTTNRLALSSAASLFSHAGNGHQMKLNKALAADTGSILMQTGFSGRAELGLTGDDDFHVKVSANGSTWKESIRLDRTTGRVTFPSGGAREQLTAARTLFVATTGSDANTGLIAGSPFLTVQKAIDTALGLDIGAFDVTIQLADGTYTAGASLRGAFLGPGTVTLKGSAASPQNVVIARTAGDAVAVRYGQLRLEALTLQTSGASGHGILAELGAVVVLGPGVRFGACIGSHVNATSRAMVRVETGAAIAIAGGAASHISAISAQVEASGNTWTLTGTPAFTTFANASAGGTITLTSATFSGAATGQRYSAALNGVINTGTGNTALLPGGTAGTVATGGVYA